MSTPPLSALPTPALPGDYRPSDDVYDELCAAPGQPRPHWEKLVRALGRIGPEEMASRRENSRRLLREHGVTYNVYGDPRGLDRPWDLDLMPLVISTEEWRRIESGLAQRARLLNLILADLYGPQRLLRERYLPPALVFANPGFLRPCHGIRAPQDIYLFLHAVDLARAADGQWWALADRTQAPSGAGYALENRIVLSSVLPDEFRDGQVQRLASFFRVLRDTLRALSPLNRENPNVVLLTPGPYNETYFEHAYLARYLGFTLVEGGDLTVRQRRVFLKTLEGLQPVDVILRRVDDNFCDPLELRGDSFLGVAGLAEAARAGHVAIANALGSGLLETPSLLAFLPGLCRHLLGEELRLPSVGTWWCGQERELAYVTEHLDRLVLKKAFGSGTGEPAFGQKLDPDQRSKLMERVRAAPHAYVGQEQVALSAAPVWANDHLVPRPLVLRAYVAATRDGYIVMPGGLTRVSASATDLVVSMQRGGGSKDTWVLANGPVSPVTLLQPPGRSIRLERAAADVPSRVGDNLFWLGRYAERLEGTIRLLRSLLSRLNDETAAEDTPELLALVQMLVRMELLPARYRQRFALAQLEKDLLALIYKSQVTGSVRELVNRLRHIASVVRDRLSADTWRIFTRLQLDARAGAGHIPLADALGLLNTLIVDLAAFSGMELENMTRGYGWRFLDIGRRLERSINLLTVMRAALAGDAQGNAALEPLLEIADSVITYRRRYFAGLQTPPVLDLLLLDESNPRSLVFQLHALIEHAASLPAERTADRSEEQRPWVSALETLHRSDVPGLCASRQAGAFEQVDAALARLSAELQTSSDTLTQHYFSHARSRVS